MSKLSYLNKIRPQSLKPLMWLSMLAITFIVVAFMAQIGQYSKSHEDVRSYFIDKWAGENDSRKETVRIYELCNKGQIGERLSFEDKVNNPIVSRFRCAELTGSEEFVALMKESTSILKNVSWPLSLLSSETDQ